MSNCFADFLKTKGLYDSFAITKENIKELCDLVGGKVRISEYCVECGEMRVFSLQPIMFVHEDDNKKLHEYSLEDSLQRIQVSQELASMPSLGMSNVKRAEWYWSSPLTDDAVRIIIFSFACTMDNKHHLDYIVKTEGNEMMKIGQFPSVADLSFPMLDEYKKDIDDQSRKELHRAIGLHAQGIGVGSYVYLRRVFERILEAAKVEAESEGIVDISEYDSMKVSERIKLLKDYLPDMISSNPKIYGIVSKGIHEMSEEECNKYFPVLRNSILLILDQWAEKRKKQELAKDLQASINAIVSELK